MRVWCACFCCCTAHKSCCCPTWGTLASWPSVYSTNAAYNLLIYILTPWHHLIVLQRLHKTILLLLVLVWRRFDFLSLNFILCQIFNFALFLLTRMSLSSFIHVLALKCAGSSRDPAFRWNYFVRIFYLAHRNLRCTWMVSLFACRTHRRISFSAIIETWVTKSLLASRCISNECALCRC